MRRTPQSLAPVFIEVIGREQGFDFVSTALREEGVTLALDPACRVPGPT